MAGPPVGLEAVQWPRNLGSCSLGIACRGWVAGAEDARLPPCGRLPLLPAGSWLAQLGKGCSSASTLPGGNLHAFRAGPGASGWTRHT